ncbi:hypothetical protein BJV78DRAFT_1262527, partial [Lactifluus subvellereus]
MPLSICSSPTNTHTIASSSPHQEREHPSYRGDPNTNLHGYHPPLRFHSISARSSFAFSPPLPTRFPQ